MLEGNSGGCLDNLSASRSLLMSYFLKQPITLSSSTVGNAFLPQVDTGLRQLMILIPNLTSKKTWGIKVVQHLFHTLCH